MTRGQSVVLFAAYLLLLLVLSYNLPFSMFFNNFHSYNELFSTVEHSNKIRTRKGKEYFSNLDPNSSMKWYQQRMQSSEQLLLAIGIISIQRSYDSKKHSSFGYLYQSASSIDRLLKSDNVVMNNSFAFVCNVDQYPKRHKDAQHLSDYMPFVERYGDNSIGLIQDLKLPNSKRSYKEVDKHKTVYEKETYDYIFCMNAGAALKPKYILLVEEDAIPHKYFASVLSYLLKRPNHPVHSFFKFYYPSKWQGFSLRFTEIADLISFSIFGTMFYYLLNYLHSLRSHQRLNDSLILITGFVLSLVSCNILGRQNLNELRRLLPQLYRIQSSEMCCTQAMLYPINIVPRLSDFMITQAMTAHTDLLIWDFADIEKLPSYQVEPNIFYHTGLHSTLPLKQKHPEEFIFSG